MSLAKHTIMNTINKYICKINDIMQKKKLHYTQPTLCSKVLQTALLTTVLLIILSTPNSNTTFIHFSLPCCYLAHTLNTFLLLLNALPISNSTGLVIHRSIGIT